MRLRLDKLVLSAGLALAMVATTVPVGAATQTSESKEATGWVIDGESYLPTSDKLDGAMAKAVTGYTVDGSISNSKLGTGKVTDVDFTDISTKVNLVDSGNTVINSEELTAKVEGLTQAASFTIATVPEVKVISTYTVPVTAEYTKTVPASASDTDIAAATSDNKDAAVTAINTAAAKLASEATTAATDSTKGITADVKATSTVSKSDFSDSEVAATSDDETGDKASVTRNVTFTEELTYALESLPSNITFDYLTEITASASDVVSVYYEKSNGQSWNTGSYDLVNSDNAVLVHVNDFTKIYYIYKGVQSAKGALLFAPTTGTDRASATVTSGDDIVATIAAQKDANTADYTKATNAPESATVAGYFTITVEKAGKEVSDLGGATLEFKIAVPTDVTPSEGKKINWMVVRTHNDEVDILPATEVDGYIVFNTGYFSDYALIYTEVAADTAEDPTQENQQQEDQQQESATTPEGSNGSSGTSENGASSKTADNSMMPLFMTTLLLALCAGSLAIYKEKKTY